VNTHRITHVDVDVSLGQWFARRAVRTPDRRALTFEGSTWTYAQFLCEVDGLASHLRERGVRSGDRVSFLGLNQPAFFLTLLATSRLGAIFVPLNFRLTAPELSFIIRDAGVHTVVCDDAHCALIDDVRDELGLAHALRVEGDADGWHGLSAAIGSHEGPALATQSPAPDDVALIMYTSGTTGKPKGAMLTHANLWWNNINALHQWDVLENDVTLVVAPLFHIGGLNVNALTTWQRGGEIVLRRVFDPATWLQDVERHRINTTFAVPAMLMALSREPGFEDADLSSLRMLIAGGAPVPEDLLRLYTGRGISVLQGFGLTETSPLVSFLTAEWALPKLGSAGVPPLLTDIRIVDSDNREIGAATPGEVCVRGPNVMKGYWNRPEATAEAIDAEGWFHTGDIGYLDADGFLYIVDRLKDMIISGGENVYAAEVENVLFAHPAIAEVAVVGAPDARWGEAVVAVAALEPDADLELEELRAFAGERLARYKLPSRLELVAELPRNAAGKVLKQELRERVGRVPDDARR
jgi:fatty-acyl-CoA synthase